MEKTAKLEETTKQLVIKQSQYDILKGQLDSIGLGIAQAPEVNQDSQLLVAGDNLSIDSFEVVNQ